VSTAVSWDETTVGTALPARDCTMRRLDAVRYCGAGCDFAGIHWNERIARSVQLDDVVAHGAMVVARLLRLVHEWTGDPTAVVAYQTRFHRPVFAPDTDEGFRFRISGTVTDKLDGGRVVLDLAGHRDGELLLGTQAVVRLDRS
jgi:acyl dehydratase